MRTFNSGPPGGRHLPPPKIRQSDLKGGAYGPGASASVRPHQGNSPQSQQEWDDLLEYHHFHADRGDPAYMYRLGRLYYQGFGGGGAGGSRSGVNRLNVGVPVPQDGLGDGGRDFNRASKWFMRVAKAVWPKDTKEATAPPIGTKKRSDGQRVLVYDSTKDTKLAVDDNFTMIAGLAAGFLGRMYLRGEGVRVDYTKAFLWFMRGNTQVRRALLGV